jgi:DNA-binding HxlR family transcriptional regulator
MLPRSYAGQQCSIARALEVVGDRWTLLVMREAFLGTRRFHAFQEHLGLARTVLSDRLTRLVQDGLLERVRYAERPERFEYHLTEKGVDLWPVLVALLQWGDRHVTQGPPPMLLQHLDCGGAVTDRRMCDRCGKALEARDVRARPGPGLEPVAA